MIRVGLDVTDPLPGEITAWESLDGIVLDSAAARRMSESAVPGLLAGGKPPSPSAPRQKPLGGWPWQQHGGYWITRARHRRPNLRPRS